MKRSRDQNDPDQNGLFYGWWIVGAAAVGLMVGATTLPQFAFGALIPSLSQEFGWSQAGLSSVVSIFMLSGIVMAPIIGMIVDRFGVRLPIALSSVAMAAVFFVLATVDFTLIELRLGYALVAIAGAGTNTIVYSRLIANWFLRKRGLALGLALVGGGLSSMVLPVMTSFVVENFGWRAAFMTLAAASLIALPLSLFIIRNKPADMDQEVDGIARTRASSNSHESESVNLRQAVRMQAFWIMVPAFFAVGLGLVSMIVLMIPVMNANGFSLQTAGLIAGVCGFMSIAGRFLMAFVLDRTFAPPIAAIILIAASIGLLMISQEPSLTLAITGAAFVGLAVGAEVDLLAYITSRYFGIQFFGKLFGLMVSCFTLGGAIGLVVQGRLFDIFGSYQTGAIGAAILVFLAAMLMFALPRYEVLKH